MRSWNRAARAGFWEFVQNLPLVAGLLLGLDAWRAGTWGLAVVWMVGGSAAGSLMIWATESKMVEGHREPLRAVLVNVAVMAVLMWVVVLYLAAGWSRWWTDLLVGAAVGSGLGIAQDLAAGSSIGLRHSAAFALAFALGLVGVRLAVAGLSPVLAILAVTLVVTVAITLLDYGPSLVARDGSLSR
jgi:preprotein translocase subunit SecE